MLNPPISPAESQPESQPDGRSLLIQNAQILQPNGEFLRGEVWVKAGIIHQVGSQVGPVPEGTRSIDATGLLLLPGMIDPQVHFREPGLEHKEDLRSASHACARGGITSFLEMPNTNPLTITQAALDDKLQRASENVWSTTAFSSTQPQKTCPISTPQPRPVASKSSWDRSTAHS